MKNPNQPIINVTEMDQIGFVVRDCVKSAESLWKFFGIGPWNIVTIPAGFLEHMTYHGKSARFGFKAANTLNKMGGIEIELLEPLDGESVYRDFLRDHGEGFHHIRCCKVDSLKSFNQTSKALEKAGFPCVMSGQAPNTAFGYFDATKVLNTVVEVVWWDSKVKAPMPSIYVYP
jgi:methylmalonyl-CoA/ethylmalonyl-CoA epimerase